MTANDDLLTMVKAALDEASADCPKWYIAECLKHSPQQIRDWLRALLARCEAAEHDLAAERIEVAHLREAFVTMERAANERETELKDAFRQGMLAAEAICDDYGELPLGSMDEAWEASKWARREP